MMTIISDGLLFLPALTRCCLLYVWGIYVSAWPRTVKPRDESQRPNEAGSAQPALHGLHAEAVTCSHEPQSKSHTFMPVIWIAGNLFSCSKQSSVQCSTPYQHGSFDMLNEGNICPAEANHTLEIINGRKKCISCMCQASPIGNICIDALHTGHW